MSNKVKTTQRGATRNQSTADFQRINIFLWGNRYETAIFNNNTGAALTAKAGILVVRDTANPTKVVPASFVDLANNDLAASIGILNVEGETALADAAEMNANYCHCGDVDAEFLVLPVGVTLNTVVGDKLLKDVLTDLGFVLKNVTENSNFDN